MQDSSGTSQVSDAVDTAKAKTQEQVDQVSEKGRGLVRDQADQRSTQAGQQARLLADTLRDTATQLRVSGDPQKQRYAKGAEQCAERLDRVGGYLTGADGEEILQGMEDVARRQPWLVAGAGLFLGVAAARVLKASSSRRAQNRLTGSGRGSRQRTVPSQLPLSTASGTPSFLPEGAGR